MKPCATKFPCVKGAKHDGRCAPEQEPLSNPIQCRVVNLDDETAEIQIGSARFVFPYADWEQASSFVGEVERLVNHRCRDETRAVQQLGPLPKVTGRTDGNNTWQVVENVNPRMYSAIGPWCVTREEAIEDVVRFSGGVCRDVFYVKPSCTCDGGTEFGDGHSPTCPVDAWHQQTVEYRLGFAAGVLENLQPHNRTVNSETNLDIVEKALNDGRYGARSGEVWAMLRELRAWRNTSRSDESRADFDVDDGVLVRGTVIDQTSKQVEVYFGYHLAGWVDRAQVQSSEIGRRAK